MIFGQNSIFDFSARKSMFQTHIFKLRIKILTEASKVVKWCWKNLIYEIDTRRKYLSGKIEKCLPRLKRCHWQKNSYRLDASAVGLWTWCSISLTTFLVFASQAKLLINKDRNVFYSGIYAKYDNLLREWIVWAAFWSIGTIVVIQSVCFDMCTLVLG